MAQMDTAQRSRKSEILILTTDCTDNTDKAEPGTGRQQHGWDRKMGLHRNPFFIRVIREIRG